MFQRIDANVSADNYEDTFFAAGTFHVPSMIDGSLSLGQYKRIIRTKSPLGAGSQLLPYRHLRQPTRDNALLVF
jgi:hypothetical protein